VDGLIRNVPDFPEPGILFKDISPLLGDAKAFQIVLDALAESMWAGGIDAVVGIESRGFIFGAALASRLGIGFVPVRKPGKLPAAVDRVSYTLEYGSNTLEMHKDALRKGMGVAIVDDLLATGGTAAATAQLVGNQGAKVKLYAFVVELSFLKGREKLGDVPIVSLLEYGAGE
jgi:adenine phosphoribosyltransferase